MCLWRLLYLGFSLQICWGASDVWKSCQQADTFGYNYDNIFEVQSNPYLMKRVATAPATWRVNFYVKAKSDAHVLLSSEPIETDSSAPEYEIVIGGGKNTFTQIRVWKGGTKATTKTPDVMSEAEFKGFWVELEETQWRISAGRLGENISLVQWTIPPFQVRYVGFSTWNDVKGTWRFACQNIIDPEAVAQDENDTRPAEERLKLDVLSFYNPYKAAPGAGTAAQEEQVVINSSFIPHNVFLSEVLSSIVIDGILPLEWWDPQLVWNASLYDNINTLHLSAYQVWTPQLSVRRAPDYIPLLDFHRASVVVKANGHVSWRASLHLKEFCSFDLTDWPRDQQNCTLQLNDRTGKTQLAVRLDGDSQVFMNRDGGGWEVMSMATWRGNISLLLNRRQAVSYSLLLAPFTGSSILTIAGFFIRPDHRGQLHLTSLSLVILTGTLLLIGYVLPAMQSTVPTLVLVYSSAILVTCLPLLLSVVLQLLPRSILLPRRLLALLTGFVCYTSSDPAVYSELDKQRERADRPEAGSSHTLVLALAIQRVFLCLHLAYLATTFYIIQGH